MAENPALDEFISTWQKRCEELKTQAISWNDSDILYLQLQSEKFTFEFTQSDDDKTGDYFHKIKSLEGDLTLSRKIAHANYQKQNPSQANKVLDKILGIIENITAIIRRSLGG